ncbi:MAG TPA: hypothetical protein VJ385_17555 [Fibrobacteria bacterium]|nr:hypothetical protein [Fibrobacteria bacterium]
MKAQAASLVEALLNRFRKDGTFGNFTEVVGGMDERFTFKDFRRMYRSVPRLRKDLVLGLLWNMMKSKGVKPSGQCRRHTPGGKYTFFHRSFCDLVVWEAVLGAVRGFGLELTSELRTAIAGSVEMALGNGREVRFDGTALTVFSYYPSRDHLVSPEHPSYKHFMSWDAGVPDNDSTCIVLGSLLRLLRDLDMPLEVLKRPAGVMKAHLGLLKAHVHRQGTYGQGYLSYESGVTDADHGVLTWIFDEHNELDPTSNINILNFLFLLGGAGLPELDADIAWLCGGILSFLRNHARAGTLFHPRLQQYYPFPSTLFFWHRFQRNLDAIGKDRVARFDPDGILPELGASIRKEAIRVFCNGTVRPNPADAALASPYLTREGIGGAEGGSYWKNPEALRHFERNQYEIFHLLYPVQVICITQCIPHAACLFSLTELAEIVKSTLGSRSKLPEP